MLMTEVGAKLVQVHAPCQQSSCSQACMKHRLASYSHVGDTSFVFPLYCSIPAHVRQEMCVFIEHCTWSTPEPEGHA